MSQTSDDFLLQLAFERGVLTLLQETPEAPPALEKAIENLDSLIHSIAIPQSA